MASFTLTSDPFNDGDPISVIFAGAGIRLPCLSHFDNDATERSDVRDAGYLHLLLIQVST
jgi:hypothetical protein